jgi:hypothetical protein
MLLLIRFPVTDKPTRRADRLRPETLTPMNPCKHRSGLAIRTPPCHDGPARNRVAGGHMRMSAILSRHSAKRDGGSPSGDGGTPPTGGYLEQARKKRRKRRAIRCPRRGAYFKQSHTHPPPCGPRQHAERAVFADFRKRTPHVAPEWRPNAVTETVPSFRRFPDQCPPTALDGATALWPLKESPQSKSRIPSS